MPVPLAGLTSAWLTACLVGAAHPEQMEDVLGGDLLHLVTGLDERPLSLTLALGAIRRRGGVAATLALPAPGDPVGIGGPADFSSDAVEAGEAVVLSGAGLGLVPSQSGDVVTWRAAVAVAPPPLDPTEAASGLRQALAEASNALIRLEVTRWQPEIADALSDLRHRPPPPLPRTLAAQTATIDRAALCREIVTLARDADGDLGEQQERRLVLDPLDRAARRALVAALGAHV